MEEIDGIKVFTERLEYWRFIVNFGVLDHTEEQRKADPGLYVTKGKEIYHNGELIAQYIPNK